MIKTIFALFIITGLTIGCTKQQVQLPLIGIKGIPEIQNHSSIWIFAEETQEGMISKMNKNNKILNTHWIFNIDKRLSMKNVIPHLISMQKNKNKDSMHKKEGMLNFFSYADISTNQISLIQFNPTEFIFDQNEYEQNHLESDDQCTSFVEIKDENIVVNNLMIPLDSLKNKLIESKACDSVNGFKVILKYNENVSYEHYLKTKVYLEANNVYCAPNEYIFTVK